MQPGRARSALQVARSHWQRLQDAGGAHRSLASATEALLNSLPNHEQTGVPAGAGSASGSRGFDLAGVRGALQQLGAPQERLRVVHVAGSKGKGSVAAMLASVLHSAGYRVGAYTSPHVASLRERIAVGLQPIPAAELDSLASRHGAALRDARLTHFEALTCLALRHFADAQVDAAVVEVGLGGARDATNVFGPGSLQLAVVTSIGLEHRAQLGDTVAEIARAKAGILQPGRPVVVAPQQEPEALQALQEAARAAGCPLTHAAQAVAVEACEVTLTQDSAHQRFSVRSHGDAALAEPLDVRSRLLGRHQAENAATAAAAALELRAQGWFRLTPASLRAGLEAASLPGRFQVSRAGAQQPWLVLDGAHTPAAAQALTAALAATFPGRPLAFVVAMADDKDHAGVLAALRQARPRVVIFTTVPVAGATTRAAPPGMLVGHWQAASFSEAQPLRCREQIKANMSAALEAARRELSAFPEEGVVCVAGSLHAVAAAMRCPGWASVPPA